MASFAATCRLSARLTSRNVRRKAASRDFSGSSSRWAAHNFVMPAMSPTMTEGNIASWRVKEGDSFSAGDVLLEIETDKAQMDVEAQDDGLVAKIMEQEGAKAVKVGARIAVLADPDDDLSSIEIPEADPPKSSPAASKSSDKSEASSSSPDKSQEPEAKEEQSQSKSESSSASTKQEQTPDAASSHDIPHQSYPLYPSVQHLLHTNGVSSEDAAKIKPTGPAGRLLKGDVLAYLGAIDKSYPAQQSKKLEKLSHLDLGNIKKTPPKPAPQKDSAKAAEEQLAAETVIAVPISLAAVFKTQRRMQESLGITLPLSTFIARASEIANENLPRAKSSSPSSDELFDAVLGLDGAKWKASRGSYTPYVTALPPPAPAGALWGPVPPSRRKPVDIIDILTGKKPQPSPAVALPGAIGVASGAAGADNIFSVNVNPGEETRAKVYLERVKSILEAEPGRCVL